MTFSPKRSVYRVATPSRSTESHIHTNERTNREATHQPETIFGFRNAHTRIRRMR